MRVIDIFYVRYFTSDGKKLSIGGIETYISNLISLSAKMGIQARVFQFADIEFEKEKDGTKVYGVKKGKFKDLYKKALSLRIASNNYINLIATDLLIPNWKVPNSIAIQHGITFDGHSRRELPLWASFLKKTGKAYVTVKRLYNVDEVVCVDNNFICWFRTQTFDRSVILEPILNFTSIGPEIIERDDSKIKIVFARRFELIRGTRLFAPVAKRILAKYQNVEITFAGDGKDDSYLRNMFANERRVFFTRYKSEESVLFHTQFHIAVVPTIYSEGTSLSLLEAMSAHCAVLCTNVGGMTNIILDEYNGLMVVPSEARLFESLSRLIEDSDLRWYISKNAYMTIKKSFSIEKWNSAWEKVLSKKFEELKNRG